MFSKTNLLKVKAENLWPKTGHEHEALEIPSEDKEGLRTEWFTRKIERVNLSRSIDSANSSHSYISNWDGIPSSSFSFPKVFDIKSSTWICADNCNLWTGALFSGDNLAQLLSHSQVTDDEYNLKKQPHSEVRVLQLPGQSVTTSMVEQKDSMLGLSGISSMVYRLEQIWPDDVGAHGISLTASRLNFQFADFSRIYTRLGMIVEFLAHKGITREQYLAMISDPLKFTGSRVQWYSRFYTHDVLLNLEEDEEKDAKEQWIQFVKRQGVAGKWFLQFTMKNLNFSDYVHVPSLMQCVGCKVYIFDVEFYQLDTVPVPKREGKNLKKKENLYCWKCSRDIYRSTSTSSSSQ